MTEFVDASPKGKFQAVNAGMLLKALQLENNKGANPVALMQKEVTLAKASLDQDYKLHEDFKRFLERELKLVRRDLGKLTNALKSLSSLGSADLGLDLDLPGFGGRGAKPGPVAKGGKAAKVPRAGRAGFLSKALGVGAVASLPFVADRTAKPQAEVESKAKPSATPEKVEAAKPPTAKAPEVKAPASQAIEAEAKAASLAAKEAGATTKGASALSKVASKVPFVNALLAGYGAYEGYETASSTLGIAEEELTTANRVAASVGGAIEMLDPVSLANLATMASNALFDTSLPEDLSTAKLLTGKNTASLLNDAFVEGKMEDLTSMAMLSNPITAVGVATKKLIGDTVSENIKQMQAQPLVNGTYSEFGTALDGLTESNLELTEAMKASNKVFSEVADDLESLPQAVKASDYEGQSTADFLRQHLSKLFDFGNANPATATAGGAALAGGAAAGLAPSGVKGKAGLLAAAAGGTAALGASLFGKSKLPQEYSGLGSVAAKYESGGKFDAIGFDSTGGYSYGRYQIATKTGDMKKFMSLLQSSNPEAYAKLEAAGGAQAAMEGSESFKSAFKELAATESFQKAQKEYILSKNYEPAARAAQDLGLDLTNPALQEAVYSTSVQHGSTGAKRLFGRALEGKDLKSMSVEDQINAIYAERSKRDEAGNLAYFKSSTADVQASVANRFTREREDLLALARQKQEPSMAVASAAPPIEQSVPRVNVEQTQPIVNVMPAEDKAPLPKAPPTSNVTRPPTIGDIKTRIGDEEIFG